MADKIETLIAVLEARVNGFDKALAKANGTFAAIETRGTKMEKTLAASGSRAASGLKPVSIQSSNIAAQFQDIAVQLQSGQSPFTIALQQGTQLSSALGSGGGLKGALTALGAGFGSLINPVSLVTIATIALGGAAVEWLLKAQHGVEETDKAFEEHIAEIKKIAQGYDDAEKAVDAYVKEANKLPQGAAASDETKKRADALANYEAKIKEVADVQSAFLQQYIEANDSFRDIGPATKQASALQELQRQFASGSVSLDDLITRLHELVNSNADGMVRQVGSEMLSAAEEAKRFAVDAGAAKTVLDSFDNRKITVQLSFQTSQFDAAMAKLKDLAPELRSPEQVAKAGAAEAFHNAAQNAQSIEAVNAAAKQYQATIAAIDEDARRKAIKSTASAYDSQRKAVTDLIAQLQLENQTVGMSEKDKEVAVALHRAGAAATEEERQKIADLVNSTYDENAAIKATADQMKEFADIAHAGLQTFLDDILQGKSGAEALGDALKSIGNTLLNSGLNSLMNTLFPSAGGGILAGLFGGARASGGPVQPGKAYVVGEKRPELFVPSSAGRIMPTVPQGGSTSGRSTNIYIDARGADSGVEQRVVSVIRQIVPGMIKQGSPAAVAQFQNDVAGGDYRRG